MAGTGTLAGRGTIDQLSGIEHVRMIDGSWETSATSHAGMVWRMYNATLGRDAEPAGLRGWVDALDHGLSLRSMASLFVTSFEFQSRYGATTDRQFVELLYRNVLGREGEAAGVQGWTDALRGDWTRETVVLGFSESQENINNSEAEINRGLWVGDTQAAVVARMYDTVFDRAPDEGGLAGWTAHMHNGMAISQLADYFIGSAEFQARYGALDNGNFVERLYNNVLNRPSEPAGFQGWKAVLDNQWLSRAEVVIAFSECAEHVALTAPQIDNGIWVV